MGGVPPESTDCRFQMPRLEHQIRDLWHSVHHRLSSDLRDDCEQEAALALWCRRHTIERLPAERQNGYAAACVRYVVWGILRRELRHRQRTVSTQELLLADGTPMDFAAAPAEREVPFSPVSLLDEVGHPHLAAALRTLPQRDYALLDLFYAGGLTDRQIASRLEVSAAAVKVRRNRILARLRRQLAARTVQPEEDRLES